MEKQYLEVIAKIPISPLPWRQILYQMAALTSKQFAPDAAADGIYRIRFGTCFYAEPMKPQTGSNEEK